MGAQGQHLRVSLRQGAVVVGAVGVGLGEWAHQLVQGAAESTEARKEALEQLDKGFKKDDTAAIFAKAQLQLQEDPRAALTTLETIDLKKVVSDRL